MMSTYETIIIAVILATAAAIAAYTIGRLKSELTNERNWSKDLQRRVQKLEENRGKLGYNQMEAMDIVTGMMVQAQKILDDAREYQNAAKRNKYRKQ